MILHLLHIIISCILLPLDNAILIAAYLWRHLSPSATHHRQTTLRDVQFYPKTALITGVDTPHGLAVARAWYQQGHRVIGADISPHAGHDLIPASQNMSTVFAAFYHIPSAHYTTRLLDIIQREKADLWIPCTGPDENNRGDDASENDAAAKQVIESYTNCTCITLDPALARCFRNPESFIRDLAEKGLPVIESHQVQTRDSVHKILHRSPTKVYHVRRPSFLKGAGSDGHATITLPKRTMSLTYSEVSEMQISKDQPWVMQQQSRLGEFYAQVLVVRGEVKALRVSAAEKHARWGRSRLDQGLAAAIHKLMDRFAARCGPRMTGHLCVRLMVDEEFDANQVRYVIHIGGCAQGAGATADLLLEVSPRVLVRSYLSILSSLQVNGVVSSTYCKESHPRPQVEVIIPPLRRRRFSLYRQGRESGIRRILPALYPAMQETDKVMGEAANLLFFWLNWRFCSFDPLPWWWHVHVYQPLRDVEAILGSANERK
ncbi:hypothetical protein FE257_005283 [Aspergillus nanangensis]|uniref:Uncharacterized protein n=1 Tax=Aspergillus nanangensis TaxID=2582783 RepID=A0AAD4GVQ0_ASPNN|nr:hypothetical protein FE257_005283 [Aspergillus nanangensis]